MISIVNIVTIVTIVTIVSMGYLWYLSVQLGEHLLIRTIFCRVTLTVSIKSSEQYFAKSNIETVTIEGICCQE